MTLTKLTDDQLTTLMEKIWARVEKLTHNPADGYQPYGWDWPTFRVIHTATYNAKRRVMEEYKRRRPPCRTKDPT